MCATTVTAPGAGQPGELQELLARQRAAHAQDPYPSVEARRADLRSLQRFVRAHRDELCQAIAEDYGHRPVPETLLTEVVPVLAAADAACRALPGWMRTQRRHVDWLTFPGARNRVLAQPLGVVGIIVPWNFPLNLSLLPLVSVFAAGNRAMVKMSQKSPRLAALLLRRIPAYFPPDKLVIVADTESGSIGPEFSRLPFDHLLFTGSGPTGRVVMAAAAQNLCPVTLELGGKSPAVICKGFPLEVATERILFGKLLNAGQVCTAVDHVWVPGDEVARFVALARRIVASRYASLASEDFASIIDEEAFARLLAALKQATERGATVVPLLDGQAWNAATRKIAPHIVLGASADLDLMQREIFGPILPVLGYSDLEEVVGAINARPRPLAFYPFSNSSSVVEDLVKRVLSGGVSVNDTVLHVAQDDLPFGGVGASGMGAYHGADGFLAFSKLRPIFRQTRFSPMRLLYPPYGRLSRWILSFLAR